MGNEGTNVSSIDLHTPDPTRTDAYCKALLNRGYRLVPTRQRAGSHREKYQCKLVKTITRNNGIPPERGGQEWEEEQVFWLTDDGYIRVGTTIKKSTGVIRELMLDLLAEGGYSGASTR